MGNPQWSNCHSHSSCIHGHRDECIRRNCEGQDLIYNGKDWLPCNYAPYGPGYFQGYCTNKPQWSDCHSNKSCNIGYGYNNRDNCIKKDCKGQGLSFNPGLFNTNPCDITHKDIQNHTYQGWCI